jgi:hypothetical protein
MYSCSFALFSRPILTLAHAGWWCRILLGDSCNLRPHLDDMGVRAPVYLPRCSELYSGPRVCSGALTLGIAPYRLTSCRPRSFCRAAARGDFISPQPSRTGEIVTHVLGVGVHLSCRCGWMTIMMPDFGRSFCFFRAERFETNSPAELGTPINICRSQILASCTISREGTCGGGAKTYYLCQPCIGEYMYTEGLPAGEQFQFQQPTSQIWCVVQQPRSTSGQEKTFADHRAGRDLLQFKDPTSGGRVKNFAGTWSGDSPDSPDIQLRQVRALRLRSVAQIIAASKNNERLVGETALIGDGWNALLRYPMPYVNFTPDETMFQADQGLVLFPDLEAEPVYDRTLDRDMTVEAAEASDMDDDFSKLHHAYLLWNRFDECEFAVKVPTEISGGGSTMHFSQVIKRPSVNSVFSLDAAVGKPVALSSKL